MALIDKNDFQILRGGVPGNYEGCHDDALEIKDAETVESGHVLELDGVTGKYTKATLTGTADTERASVALYTVIEGNSGNDSFSGEFADKAVGLKGSFKMQTSKFNASGMAAGEKVTAKAGLLEVDSALPSVGQVVSYDAVAALIVVEMF